MSPEGQLCQACPLEFSVRPVQLAPSGDGAPEDNKDEDLVRADAGLALIDADPPGQTLESSLDGTATDVGRPRKRGPCPDRMLDGERDLNSDASPRHPRDCPVRQAVKAVAPARCRGSARHLRAARRRNARAGVHDASTQVPTDSWVELRGLQARRHCRCRLRVLHRNEAGGNERQAGNEGRAAHVR